MLCEVEKFKFVVVLLVIELFIIEVIEFDVFEVVVELIVICDDV